MNKNNDLISIIVPVYNVQNYLKECIDSILSQTYRKLEIILIDDGSTDSSGKICDRFREKDNRIKVVHQKNKGLSSARNYGIAQSNGKYIALIDSDDFIADTFIEDLYRALIETSSDVAALENLHFTDGKDSDVLEYWQKNKLNKTKYKTFSKDEIYSLALYQKIKITGAQQKLYKREIFKNIEFPVGRYFEDLATLPMILSTVKRLVLINKKLYAYRIRRNSIMNKNFTSKKLDCIWVGNTIHSFVQKKEPYYIDSAECAAFRVNRVVYEQIPADMKKEKKRVWNELNKYRKVVSKDSNAPFYDRILAKSMHGGQAIFGLTLFCFNIAKRIGHN